MKKILIKAFFYGFLTDILQHDFLRVFYGNKINRLHERCLRIVYGDNASSFEERLGTDNSISVHHRNIQALTTELYKIADGLSPGIT